MVQAIPSTRSGISADSGKCHAPSLGGHWCHILDWVLHWQVDDWHTYRHVFYGSWLPRWIWLPSQVSARFWWGDKGVWRTEGHLCENLWGWMVSTWSAWYAVTNCLASIHSGALALSAQLQNMVSVQIIAAAIKEHQEGSTTEDESEWWWYEVASSVKYNWHKMDFIWLFCVLPD